MHGLYEPKVGVQKPVRVCAEVGVQSIKMLVAATPKLLHMTGPLSPDCIICELRTTLSKLAY